MIKVNPEKGRFNLVEYFQKKIQTKEKRVISKWQKTMPPVIIKNIKSTIERGNSPVKGYGRFTPYSPSYREAIKRGRYPGKKLRPVNLTLTGKMMRSLISRPTQKGFVVYFTSKLARIHSQEGPGGYSEYIRKVMPGDGEQFKRAITIESDKFVKEELGKELKKMF